MPNPMRRCCSASGSLWWAGVDTLALIITGLLLASVLLGMSGSARLVIATAFTGFVPGWALVGAAGVRDGVRRLALSVPLSFTLAASGATVMALVHAWYPMLLLGALAAISIAAILWHPVILLRHRLVALPAAGRRLGTFAPIGPHVAALHPKIAVPVVTAVICVAPAAALVLVVALQPVTALISFSLGSIVGLALVNPHRLLSSNTLIVALGSATMVLVSLRTAGLGEGSLAVDALLTLTLELWAPAALGTIVGIASLPVARLVRLRLGWQE
jgi:hypothetical protein